MARYLEVARQVLAAIAVSEKAVTTAEKQAAVLSRCEPPGIDIGPPENWPQSLAELAAEVGQRSGDQEAARREVWMSWCEWKAAALNRLFQEQGTSGQPGRITAATIEHGEKKERH